MAGVIDPYKYPIEQCEVLDKEKLVMFREKRQQWLDWLKTDEHHAISTLVSSMAWNDVLFRTLSRIGATDQGSGLHNPFLTEALVEGHIAIQILAIRRLMDKGNNVISLWRLLKDMKKHIGLFTREIFIAYDGLPYDYEAVQRRVMAAHIYKGAFFGAKSGPDAHWPSKRAHEIFDRLAGIDPGNRSRDDCVPLARIETLERWLIESDADKLVSWSHKFLAHAAERKSRNKIDVEDVSPSLSKITAVLRSFARVSEAIWAYVLYDGGYGAIVPVPQFNQFEHLASPLLAQGAGDDLEDYWTELVAERDAYLEETLDALVA